MRLFIASFAVFLSFSISGCGRGLANSQPSAATTQSVSPPLPSLSFSIQPDKVAPGASVTLAWSTKNATSVSIDNGIGTVAPSGSLSINAKTSETFTATATGPAGTVQREAALTILALPTINVTACPAAEPSCDGDAHTLIRKNSSALISWQTQNATSVSIDQAPGKEFGTEDSYATPPLSESTTYLLTATGPGGTASAQATVDVTSHVPDHSHVAFIVEENHSYSQVIGNPQMPFLNHLIENGAMATEYFANTHGSLRDYFELSAGKFLVPGGDFAGSVTADEIAAHLINGGKTWKSYAESLPWVGYTGYNVYPYEKDHNPFAYFTAIANDPAQAGNLVPFDQLAADIEQGTLPNLIYIAPNARHDAHDCPSIAPCSDGDKLAAADQWLQANITPLLHSEDFQADGLLLITFDESIDSDTENGGGHVILVAVGPKVRAGYRSKKFYQHQNALRTMCEALDVRRCPGDAEDAESMLDLFVP